ncbi:TPA: glycine betaine ABC transporter ATP-binding protein [Candidatus Acetothermia bacterium]|nr:glycine betaine ABC transporter ATP-binding protein [Candidatus Acetothermia bacterium]
MIRLEEVTKVYPDGTEAVRGVTLQVAKGEFCVLLGPSGCGKTTTLKMINRLIPLSSGRITVDGVDIYKVDPNDLRRGIGYAIQEIGLFPHMTVGENIATVPRLLRWPKERIRRRVEELLELVGLVPPEEFSKKYPAELSGGQRQRVGVARALGADPPILLMDEPFGAIDPITRERLQDEFLRIQAEIKKTIVFVTHDINEAVKLGDRIALMREGRLVQYATPAELLAHPKDGFVRDFVGADRTLKALRLLRVREVMEEKPPTVEASKPLAEARERLERLGVNFLPVVDREGRFLGWLNRTNLRPEGRVAEVMTPYSVLATPDTPLNEALSLMFESAVGNLAVVDGEGRLRGLLTFRRLHEVLRESYREEGQG